MNKIEYNFIYIKYWVAEPAWSVFDLANHYNCTPNVIYYWMRKWGIPFRNKEEAAKNKYLCPWKREDHKESVKNNRGH